MATTDLMIAVCGLDCRECDVFQAADNPTLAGEIADWLREERGVQIDAAAVRCTTCRGDRAGCWSDDCWIYACCVERRRLDSCHRCGDFPCARLRDWAQGSRRYAAALQRLMDFAH